MANGKPIKSLRSRKLSRQDSKELNALFAQMHMMDSGENPFDDGWLQGWVGKDMNEEKAKDSRYRLGWRVGRVQRKMFDESTKRKH